MTDNNKKFIIFDKAFTISIICFSIIIGIICLFPLILTTSAFNYRLDFSKTGQIGDTIGGTMGPFIAIAAAILTFIAFWVQYKSNAQQTLQFHKQDLDVKLERFENKFYELLKIQRENLNEIEIETIDNKVVGRKAFVSMFIELNACFEFVSLFINAYDKNLGFQKDDNETILDIAYLIFFMGIGKSSDKLITISLKDRCDEIFLTQLIKYLNTEVKEQFRTGRRNFSLPADGYQPKYMPFDGHMTRLGHYYRHLYQTVGFIANQDNELINESGKCEYAKTLRAQLSDYEQLILFYNANSSLGKSWIKEGYLKRFRMIKNMPVPLADFGVNPYIKFKNEIEYWKTMKKSFFEWDDRK